MSESTAIEKSRPRVIQDSTMETAAGRPEGRAQRWYQPRVDVLDLADAWRILVDLPGVTDDQIELNVAEDVLTIRAVPNERYDGLQPLRWEYVVGPFERRFRLDERIDVTRITANLEDGVLSVTAPKVERAARRRIDIRAS